MYIIVTKFKTPDNFSALLSSQDYGPTTQLITDDVRKHTLNYMHMYFFN